MYIIEDTAQKKGKHELKNQWWAENGISISRCHLPFGDYCLPPKVAIDTKADMSEIAGNMCGTTKEHIRFREECKKAQAHGCTLVFLIENEDGISSIDDVERWLNPRRFVSEKAVTGERLAKTMRTMSDRYGCRFMFCSPEESAQKIKEILEQGAEHYGNNTND